MPGNDCDKLIRQAEFFLNIQTVKCMLKKNNTILYCLKIVYLAVKDQGVVCHSQTKYTV